MRPATPRRMPSHSSSASGVASIVATPCSSQVAISHATCSADFDRKCRKFVPKPACTRLIIIRLGNSADRTPCSVWAPSCHRSLIATPSRPTGVEAEPVVQVGGDLEPGGEDEDVDRVLDAAGHHPGGGDRARRPGRRCRRGARSGRLNAGRYSSWKHTRLQCLPYQGFSFAAVSGSSTISSTRWRSASMVSKSDCSSAAASSGESAAVCVSSHITSVQPSCTRSLSGLAAGDGLGEVADPLVVPARRQAPEPLLVGGAVVAHADRGGGALEDEELLRGLGEAGHGLHRGGPGADDPDPLAAQLLHRLRVARRRCSRSPSGWCGRPGPRSRSMPGMPGSFALWRMPPAVTRYLADNSSPRVVRHLPALPRPRPTAAVATSVWNRAWG